MESIARAWREHPVWLVLLGLLSLYMATQLGGMIHGMWTHSETRADRWVTAGLGVGLACAFYFAWRFLFGSVLA